ncbi:hypothetical protein [Sphingomonas quercus]|uniref:Uncharacterized protein n=1 Tax=Sphingomonas quercus TaxID=2842451 RepID=A0ABS6BPZ4_9SPHN|nr:hypothetical protein [Sphingomonas quercus]MBU3079476.1 hypothetical protein [Sphingomonas quercus]
MNRDQGNIDQSTAEPAEGPADLPPPQTRSPRAAPSKDAPRSPLDPPGVSGGTAGTGGDNKVQDELDR